MNSHLEVQQLFGMPPAMSVDSISPNEMPPEDNPVRQPDDPPKSEEAEERAYVIRSEDLMQDHREIWIEHGTEMYRLRITNSGKLLLTK